MKILTYFIVSLAIFLGFAGVAFFIMSFLPDSSIPKDFEMFKKNAFYFSISSIALSMSQIYYLRKCNKRVLFYICIAVIVINLPPILFVSLFNMNAASREIARRNTIMYRLEIIYDITKEYAAANGGYLPQSEGWSDTLMKFNNTLKAEDFKHPKIPDHVIAYNSNIAGISFDKLPNDTIIFFEAKGDINLAGSQELINCLDTRIGDIILAIED